ncbi:MAG: hypothetical protein AABY07_10835 [Nanoarchaeota archaeon]
MIRYQSLADVYIFEPGNEGFLTQDKQGWAYADLFYRSFNAYSKAGNVERDNTKAEFQKLSLINHELSPKIICTQFPTCEGNFVLADWNKIGNWTETEHLDPIIGGGSANKRFMCLETTNILSSCESRFIVAEKGSWSVVLRRSTPAKTENIDFCASYIEFDKYLIYMPYTEGPSLWTFAEGQWRKIKDLFLITPPQQINDEGIIIINFLNIDGNLLFSGDWFKNWDIYKEVEELKPKDYKVKISHRGSAFHFNYYINKCISGYIFNEDIPVYYQTDLNYLFEELGEEKPTGTTITVTDNAGNPSTNDKVRYRVIMTPTSTPITSEWGISKTWYITPALEGVMVKHDAEVQTTPTPFINLAAPYGFDNGAGERVYSISGDEGIDYDSATWTVMADNEDGKLSDPALTDTYLRPFRIIKIKGGYKDINGTNKKNLFTGVLLSPEFGQYQTLKSLVQLRLANMSYLCEQTFNKGDWPIFDKWKVSDALTWLAKRCRIPTTKHLFSDIGNPNAPINQLLSKGPANAPLWEADILQTSAWQLMKKIAEYIKFDLFFDRSGNLVCQPKFFVWNGTSYDHHFYMREHGGLTGAELNSFNIATDVQLTIIGEDWYNTVYIGGFNRVGGAISTFRQDPDSVYTASDPNYIGFEKAVAASYEAFLTREKTQEIASSLSYDALSYPRKISLITYFNPDILPNQVIRISGSKHKIIGGLVSNDYKYYRILSLHHNLDMKGISTTNIIGEYVSTQGWP